MSIALDSITKYFGKHLVVNNISLEINEGEFFALLGESGSGKSTILRIIAGLAFPDKGRVVINNQDMTIVLPQKRGLGFVFQNYAIFEHLTVAGNIDFGLKVRRIPKKDRLQRQDELLELVGLSGFGDRYPNQLSGGQRQRVALARALAYKPSVLLLDEPFGALDVRIRAQLRESIKEIQNNLKITTILVTHDQEEAFELADRIGILDKGRLVEIGTAESLYQKPKTSFAATFIGGGNVMVGRFKNNLINLGNLNLSLPTDAPKHNEGDPIRILFRPEEVLFQKDAFTDQQNLYTFGVGYIEDQQFVGSHYRTRIRLDDLRGVRPLAPYPRYGRSVSVVATQLSQQTSKNLKVGEACYLALKNYHVLNPSTLRILIKFNNQEPLSSAWIYGAMLAKASHGVAKLLHICAEADSVDKEQKKLKTFINENPELSDLRLDLTVKSGSLIPEFVAASQEGFYEVVIIDRDKASSNRWRTFNELSVALLQDAQVPVLLLAEKRSELKKILICTAAGEPGKSDVQLGARFARQTQAEVTVLHVANPYITDYGLVRSERHLSIAKKFLDELGIKSKVLIKKGNALKEIITTADEGDYDLIVIGSPVDLGDIYNSFGAQLINATTRPVLIVPVSK